MINRNILSDKSVEKNLEINEFSKIHRFSQGNQSKNVSCFKKDFSSISSNHQILKDKKLGANRQIKIECKFEKENPNKTTKKLILQKFNSKSFIPISSSSPNNFQSIHLLNIDNHTYLTHLNRAEDNEKQTVKIWQNILQCSKDIYCLSLPINYSNEGKSTLIECFQKYFSQKIVLLNNKQNLTQKKCVIFKFYNHFIQEQKNQQNQFLPEQINSSLLFQNRQSIIQIYQHLNKLCSQQSSDLNSYWSIFSLYGNKKHDLLTFKKQSESNLWGNGQSTFVTRSRINRLSILQKFLDHAQCRQSQLFPSISHQIIIQIYSPSTHIYIVLKRQIRYISQNQKQGKINILPTSDLLLNQQLFHHQLHLSAQVNHISVKFSPKILQTSQQNLVQYFQLLLKHQQLKPLTEAHFQSNNLKNQLASIYSSLKQQLQQTKEQLQQYTQSNQP